MPRRSPGCTSTAGRPGTPVSCRRGWARLNPVAWAQRRRDLRTADPEHPFTTLLAEIDGVPAGFTTFGPYRNDQDRGDLDPTYGELLAIYVERAHWGDGTATALFAAARDGLAAAWLAGVPGLGVGGQRARPPVLRAGRPVSRR